MNTFSTLMLCLFISACKSDESRLQLAKEKSIQTFEDSAPLVLKKKTFQEINMPSSAPKESLELAIENTTVVVPKPTSNRRRKKRLKAYELAYPTFDAVLLESIAGKDMATLPAKWGKDDLEKMRTLNTASRDLIDQAKTPEELKQAVTLLTASSTLALISSDSGNLWVNTKEIQGLVTGKIGKTKSLDFMFRANSVAQTANYHIIFAIKPGCKEGDILDFISKISIAKKVKKKTGLLKALIESTIKPTEKDLPMTIPGPIKNGETATLNVSENGSIHFQGTKHTSDSIKTALTAWAKTVSNQKKTPILQISVDPNLPQQTIVDLLNIIRESNINTVSFSDKK